MKEKTILLWGAIPDLPPGESFDLSYKRSGNNIGNILIGHGVVSVLDGYDYVFRSQLSSPEEADEKCCHIVIPAANFLWHSFDFGYMADFIERTSLPVTVIGLGAQTNDRSRVSKVHPNTLRLIKVISERAHSIGVRGYYSAEVLASNGVMNTEALGCPSLYTNGEPPGEISNNFAGGMNDVAVNFSRRVATHSFDPETLNHVENILLDIAIKHNSQFVIQDELEEAKIMNQTADAIEMRQVAKYFWRTEQNTLSRYFTNNSRYFLNVPTWSNFIKTRSGVIGSRLHGNIISLINGRPGFTIVHDSRTLEVCALIGSPYLHIKDLMGLEITEELLLERIFSADYELLEKNLVWLFSRYKSFLRKQGLSHRLP